MAMRRARADRRATGAAAEDALAEADLADPTPDVEELFRHYDALYFQGALGAADFAVKWRPSLPGSSFGSCTFSKPSNTIALSEIVLKYRSCTDLKKALLHEMIHAIIYVKHGRRNCSQHGPVFRAWMDAINSCSIMDSQRPVSGYNITTRHDFKSEKPCSFKGIIWKCESCGDRLPRAPNLGHPSDACCIENDHDAPCGNILCHWHNHKSVCGGSYESMGLQSVTPVQKKTPKGTQLLLTYPLKASKSKGAIKESSSAELHENTKVTEPNAEDEHLYLSSLVKPAKKRRSEGVQKATALAVESPKQVKPKQPMVAMEKQKAIILAVEPPKEVKPKQALVAMEKHVLFSPAGCNDARSLAICTSKKTDKQHKPEDVQKLDIPTQRHMQFSLEGCSNGESLENKSLQKTGKRRRSEIIDKASILPDEPPKEMNRKEALVAMKERELISPGGCNSATSPGNGTSNKASKQHKPVDIQKLSIQPAVTQGKPKVNENLVPKERHNLFSLEGCNDVKTSGSIAEKKAIKQLKPDGVERPGARPTTSQGKPKLTQEFVTTEMHKLSSVEACNYAKSLGSNTSKQADEQHKPTGAEKACSQHAYPLRRPKRDLIATEKNERFSNKKLLDESTSKRTRKHYEPEDIQKTTVLQAVPGCKLKESSFFPSQKKRKCRRQPARKKEYAVMSAWMNIYESDRSSGSTEPLVNKRTVRRKREKERLQMYSSKRKANSPFLDNSRIDVSVGGHKFVKDESALQSWSQSLCCSAVVPITAKQVVTAATGGHSQTSAPCLDIVPLQPADAPSDSIPSESALIDISDDD